MLCILLQNEPKKDVSKNCNRHAEKDHEKTGGHLIPVKLLLLCGQGLVVLKGIKGLLGEGNGALAEPNEEALGAGDEVHEEALCALCKANAEALHLVPDIYEERCDRNTDANEEITSHAPKFFNSFHSIHSIGNYILYYCST